MRIRAKKYRGILFHDDEGNDVIIKNGQEAEISQDELEKLNPSFYELVEDQPPEEVVEEQPTEEEEPEELPSVVDEFKQMVIERHIKMIDDAKTVRALKSVSQRIGCTLPQAANKSLIIKTLKEFVKNKDW